MKDTKRAGYSSVKGILADFFTILTGKDLKHKIRNKKIIFSIVITVLKPF